MIKYLIILTTIVSMFVCIGCSKRTYAEVKAQLDSCISTKMMEFKMTGDGTADIKAFESIVDFCKAEISK